MELLTQIQQHRQQAIVRLPQLKIEDTKQVVTTLQSYWNNMREEQKLITPMCNERKKNEKKFWSVKKLLIETDISAVYPSRGTLIAETAFGKPHLLKSYTVVPTLS